MALRMLVAPTPVIVVCHRRAFTFLANGNTLELRTFLHLDKDGTILAVGEAARRFQERGAFDAPPARTDATRLCARFLLYGTSQVMAHRPKWFFLIDRFSVTPVSVYVGRAAPVPQESLRLAARQAGAAKVHFE